MIFGNIDWTGQTECWPKNTPLWPRVREQHFRIYRPWSEQIAYGLYAKYKVEGVGSDDYVQFAHLGLLEAIDSFNPLRGIKFKAFAHKRVKGAVLNNILKFSEKATSLHASNQRVKERLQSFQENGHEGRDDAANLINNIVHLTIGFLMESDASGAVKLDEVQLDNVEIQHINEKIDLLIQALPSKQQTVLTSHYREQRSFTEIAHSLGVSLGRVSQIHTEAINKLKKQLGW